MSYFIQVADIESENFKIPVIFYYDDEGKIGIRLSCSIYSEKQFNYIWNVLVPKLGSMAFDNIPKTSLTLATPGFLCEPTFDSYGRGTGVFLTAHPVNLVETMQQLLAFFGKNIISPESDYRRPVERAGWSTGDLLRSNTWGIKTTEGMDTHLDRFKKITARNETILNSNTETIAKSFARRKYTV